MAKEDKLQRFGRYLILDHLVDGGMAKICRARFLGEQADKLVAIKMIQTQFSKDAAFKTMFMNEIKVTFGLIHPNIAQTYDYGEVGGQLYTSMEYVDGSNLKQFLQKLKERKSSFPVEISLYIISQVCQGLGYAHHFTDKLTGKPLNIIHRDISPHNIMITYDGAVKLIDFGIAKAETNSEATQAGTIKGKLSYLAPEYLEGLTLDHRYDQFAVGATLWELLCGTKLFQAPNDLAVLKLIQKCKIPAPSTINPRVPKELDALVLRSLSKNRDERFEDMDQMNRALVKFLYAQHPDFNSSDLAHFSRQLFSEEFEKDHQKFLQYGKIDIAPYLRDLKEELRRGSGATAEKTQTQLKRRVVELELDKKATPALNLEEKIIPKRGGTVIHHLGEHNTGSYRSRTRTDLRVKQMNASAAAEVKVSSGIPIFKMAAAIALLVVGYSQADLIKKWLGVSETKSNTVVKSNPEKEVNSQEFGTLLLSGYDPFMELYVDGQAVSYSGAGISLTPGEDHEIKVEKKGHKTFKRTVAAFQKAEVIKLEIPSLEKIKVGVLSIAKSPAYAEGSKLQITIDNETKNLDFPVSLNLPVGTYQANILDPMLNTQTPVKFVIEADKKTEQFEPNDSEKTKDGV